MVGRRSLRELVPPYFQKGKVSNWQSVVTTNPDRHISTKCRPCSHPPIPQKESPMFGKGAAILATLCAFSVATVQADATKGLQRGKPELRSAGPMAFGPGGILFLSDPKGAAIFAIDTGDAQGDRAKASVNVENLNEKIASLLGTRPNQIRIQDLAVNPASGKVYLSVARGAGPDAQPVVLRIDSTGAITEFPLDNVPFAKATLPNPPEDAVVQSGRRKQNNRDSAITDIAFIDGQIIVAGLSNEEFSSNLRAIRFPFGEVSRGSIIEIFHGNHGRIETRAPVRTFVPISLGGDPQIIAAYTCTPLVRIPLAELQPGVKIHGTTIAELGNHNQPLDIVAYQKNGTNYLLLANSAHGVMKISTEDLTKREGITKRVRSATAGQPFEVVGDWKGVTQLDQLNDQNAIVLIEEKGSPSNLRTLPLP
jgi:hypothetical protein